MGIQKTMDVKSTRMSFNEAVRRMISELFYSVSGLQILNRRLQIRMFIFISIPDGKYTIMRGMMISV